MGIRSVGESIFLECPLEVPEADEEVEDESIRSFEALCMAAARRWSLAEAQIHVGEIVE